MSLEQCTGACIDEHARGEFPERDRVGGGAQRRVMNADCRAGGRVGNHREDFVPLACFVLGRETAMDANRDLAASAECG
jgi:hypothetical protein